MSACSLRETKGVGSSRSTEDHRAAMLLVDMVCMEVGLQREGGSFVLEERLDVVAQCLDRPTVVVSCHRDRSVGMIFVLVSDRSCCPSHCHSRDHDRVHRPCCSSCYYLRDRSDAGICVVYRILYQSICR